MIIYAVMCDAGGAHETGDVMSLWSSRELAETEITRLRNSETVTTTHGGDFEVEEAEVDKPSDVPVLG